MISQILKGHIHKEVSSNFLQSCSIYNNCLQKVKKKKHLTAMTAMKRYVYFSVFDCTWESIVTY